MDRTAWRPWVLVWAFSLVFFLINASTYSALGVVLPTMVAEQKWSWTVAGFGFTLLGAATGASSFIPAFLIRRLGVRPTLALGTAAMAGGLFCFSATHGPVLYFLGAALCGVGYQMMALIPGTHVLAMVFRNRGLPFGVYFTSGSVGGVAGPVMALWLMSFFHEQWRVFWLSQVVLAIGVGAVCILLVGSPEWLERQAETTDRDVAEGAAETAGRVYRTRRDWTTRSAIRTPQFYVILAAYFVHLLVGITVASFSVAHLTQRGVGASLAVGMLSLESLAGVMGRAAGGALGDHIDPKHLLVFALAALTGGALALSVAHGYVLLLIYAVGSGVGFGLAVLAVTLLLLNYYGRTHNLEIFALTCLIGAASALGPVIGGAIRDYTGQFSSAFQLEAGVLVAVLAAVMLMRPPRADPEPGSAPADPAASGLATDAA